jgi:endonuclease/exonuclease/phosphatase family metal-dependent hydrolase
VAGSTCCPHRACRQPAKIGNLLGDFDLVALQEADGGSLRSGYVNQVEHLAQLAPSPTGTNNSIATSGAWPSTAMACSVA